MLKTVFNFLTLTVALTVTQQLENGGKIWALLAAGSNGYDNYRHQADVCHAFQILRKNGIPEENIIVMMYDDVANSSENPWKGVLINEPNGTNVYEGVKKDYTGDDVTPENFLKVLTGDAEGMKGIGTGRVIQSGPNDHIFVNFADHGSVGFLVFPNGELYAQDLEKAFLKLVDNKKFSKMVVYIEACESGSMFEHLLPDNENIFVVTAADPHESSYAWCMYGPLNTFLGDVFSVNWMHDVEQTNLLQASLHHIFEEVRYETNTSHVEEYGDLNLGSMRAADFMGFTDHHKQPSPLPSEGCEQMLRVPSRHVPLAILQSKLERAQNREERNNIKFHIHRVVKMRRGLDQTVRKILKVAAEGDVTSVGRLERTKHSLTRTNMHCYKRLVTKFSDMCFKLSENPYALQRVPVFLNVCEEQHPSEEAVINAMEHVCTSKIKLTGVV
ncbi:legumain-like [Schistocerca gregaria]|uniref:legumain n=1 Tax=Schistocerca gregaria TaxID=7010 RepID=A0A8E5NJ64_SCHGR|nr:legumain-like [Schistocerca gregaria]XP_049863689.1 legumain-like [Schistocerca gregaria]XP_049863690.1 legumain-like [Schistocerca gregaria]QVD39401.1 Legumain [Schistocerca gregaria]